VYLPARKYIEMAIVFFYIVKKQITMPFACNVMLIKQYDECAKKQLFSLVNILIQNNGVNKTQTIRSY